MQFEIKRNMISIFSIKIYVKYCFSLFLCALTKFRLLTKTDPRVFFYADMNTHHGLFLFFSFNKDEFNNNYRTFSMFTE